jgi:hypothetical protein
MHANHVSTVSQMTTKPSRRPRQPAPRRRTRLASIRRFNGLVLKFSQELLGARDALTAAEHEMVRQAAAMMLRAEQLQAAIVSGEPVDPDELIRVTSEMRRAIRLLGLKSPPPPAPPRFSPMKALREAKRAKESTDGQQHPAE